MAPVLRLAFIYPQQAVLHRHVVVWRPQIRRTAKLAVPGVSELMRQQIPIERGLAPLSKGIGIGAILARLVVLEAVLLDLIAQGIEKIVVCIVMRAENLVGLLH